MYRLVQPLKIMFVSNPNAHIESNVHANIYFSFYTHIGIGWDMAKIAIELAM